MPEGSSRNEILSRISKMGQPMLPVSSVASTVPQPTVITQEPVMVCHVSEYGNFVLWVLVFDRLMPRM